MFIQDYLSEGITFFKDSKRLKKIADKIEKSSKYSSAEVSIVVSKLRGIATVFENLETAFRNASTQEDKEKIKSDFNAARAKYTSFIKMINREGFVKALKVSIDLGIIGAAIFIGYKNIDAFSEQQIRTTQNGVQGKWENLQNNDSSASIPLPSLKKEIKIQNLVNGALMGATTASAIGFTMLFKKLFTNKGDELFNKTREALFTLEKAEKMTDIKKVEENPSK